jgi:ATP phosphoribosyltransferase
VSGLRIAVPTGALLPGACELLTRAGICRVDPEMFDRALMLQCDGHTRVKVRPTDVPVYVEMGAADCGMVGKDVLWEHVGDSYELVDLRFGFCRLVLAAPAESSIVSGTWPAPLRVATKYPAASRRFFDGLGVNAELVKLHGSIELAPATGLADAVLDLVVSGRTLAANGLVEVAEAGRSTARLLVNQSSLKTRAAAIGGMVAALRTAVAASVTA